MSNNIGVIGIGRLGLSFALLAEKCGYNIIACDKREDYLTLIDNRIYKTSEPHISEWLSNAKNFETSDLSGVVSKCDIIFCFVATPSLPDGSYDHSSIDDVVSDLQRLHIQGMDLSDKILIIGCTTMPGYCDSIQSRLDTSEVIVVYNPEFIAQGSIIQGLKSADMVLIGTNDEAAINALSGIYRTIMTKEPKFNIMSRTAAEITKISINCYLTMKIAYANMIGEITINSGIANEVDTVLKAIGDDSRIGNKFLKYGFGYGGLCLPRDMKALGIHAGLVSVPTRLPVAIDHSNEMHGEYLVDYFTTCNPDKNVPFIFPQLSYKKGVDITVESQQLRLALTLHAYGYTVYTTDNVDTFIPQLPVGITGYTINI